MKCGDRVKLSRSYLNSLEFMHEHLKRHKQHNCITVTNPDREGTVVKLTWDDEVVVLWDGCRVPDPKTHQYAEMDLTVTVSAPSSALQRRSNKPCRHYHGQ